MYPEISIKAGDLVVACKTLALKNWDLLILESISVQTHRILCQDLVIVKHKSILEF